MTLTSAILFAAGFLIILVLTQDLQIFPGFFISKIKNLLEKKRRLPAGIESAFIQSEDGIKLEVWRYLPDQRSKLSDYVAIVFHGNGGPLENFIFVQMWLGELGITSYGFDYRGFGQSSGWPSERGFYRDSDAAWNYALEREKIDPSRIIVVGISVGSGPAARIAALHQPKLLLLCSAFTDLRSVVRAQPILGLLAPFVWHKFPTIDFVRGLKTTDLLLGHASHDSLVPSTHAGILESAYTGTGRKRRFTSESSGHNAAFYDLRGKFKDTLLEWL